MKIKFVRSGGFAGTATNVAGTVEFDEHGGKVDGEATDYHRKLNPQEVERLRTDVDPGALAAAKGALSAPGAVRDGYQYDITVVTKDGKSHALTLGEGGSEQLQAVAPGVADLRSWIQEEAQKIWSYRISKRK
jgi:hypothetical protein